MAKDEFYLPQDIIHHIQSFLNARDEAQSSVLAKSWNISRPTRPVLAFVEIVPKDALSHLFLKSSTETLHKYKTLKLKQDKFMLKLNETRKHNFSLCNTLAGELITSALDLGVSEIELMLTDCALYNLRYDLPAQVFASTSLTRLLVDRYVIDGVIGDRVLCSRLKSLVLCCVKTKDDVVRDILARCPLIENLDLYHCVGLDKLNVSRLINLVEVHITGRIGLRVEFMDLDRMNVTEFRCLRLLNLTRVRISTEFFTKFGSMFPCVENLSLEYCGDHEEINISSHSVKNLSLHPWTRLKKVQLNIPNILKFVLKVDTITRHFKPLLSISFDNVSKDWESYVQLTYVCNLTKACWFVDLRKFLIQLTLSRIYLNVDLYLDHFYGDDVLSSKEIPWFSDLPKVENLTIRTRSARYLDMMQRLLLGFSRSCCPNSITKIEGF